MTTCVNFLNKVIIKKSTMAVCPKCGHEFEEESPKAPGIFSKPNAKSIFDSNPSIQQKPAQQSFQQQTTRQMQHIAITTGNRALSLEEIEKRKKEQENAARILSLAAQGKKTR